MRILTADIIEHYSPCRDKLEIFKAEWPNGMSITRANFDRALALGIETIDWLWLISESFPRKLADMYHTDAWPFISKLKQGGLLSLAEGDAIRLDWTYYYLLGIRRAQLADASFSSFESHCG